MAFPTGPLLSGIGTGLSSLLGLGDNDKQEDIYNVDTTNWYKTLPYGFVFYSRAIGNKDEKTGKDVPITKGKIFYLPISPQNITVTTHFATNVVTTLYGVVEEHSPVRFYDMTISGTTGIAPKYVREKGNSKSSFLGTVASSFSPDSYQTSGRSAFDNALSIDLGAINTIVDSVNELAGYTTGISPSNSGYAAFHNFYRYLMLYKKDAAGVGKAGNVKKKVPHQLSFLNYKDGIKYDCAIQSFTLVRDTENPMLYKYSIKARCYNLRNVNGDPQGINQFEKLGLLGPNASLSGGDIFGTMGALATGGATAVSGIISTASSFF